MTKPFQVQTNKPGDSGRAVVFAAIRTHGPVARIDIASRTGLSPATVTVLTADLLKQGLIEEVPAQNPDQPPNRGRPRVDLQINAKAHLVAGLKLSDRAVTVSILDFNATVRASFAYPALKEVYDDADELIAVLKAALTAGLSASGLELADLSAVGLAMPGIVDVLAGVVHWSPSLRQTKIPLQHRFGAELGLPVFVDNDANLVAIAEQRLGLGQDTANFVVVTVEQGIGLGIVIDGQIYRGANGCGAELGHTKVHLDGALCRCGQRGCLEAYVGDFALLREAATNMAPLAGDSASEKIKSLLSAAKSGDVAAQTVLDRAGRIFAMGLANIANIFAPELIILSSERVQNDFLYADAVIRDMSEFMVQTGELAPKVVVHHWDYQMWATGAAVSALDGVINIELSKERPVQQVKR